MAKKRIKSKPGLFGMVYHYDENGKYVGKSRPGLLDGTKVHFDEKGQRVGTSRPGLFWEEVHHDEKNDRYITSFPSVLHTIHRSNGRTVGTTRPSFFDRSYTTIETGEGVIEETEEYFDEYADDEIAEYLEGEEDYSINAEDDTDSEAEKNAYEERSKAKTELPAPIASFKTAIKWLIGVFCVICVLAALLIVVSSISRGHYVNAAIFAISGLLFGKLAAFCLKSKQK